MNGVLDAFALKFLMVRMKGNRETNSYLINQEFGVISSAPKQRRTQSWETTYG